LENPQIFQTPEVKAAGGLTALQISGIIFERLKKNESFARIRSKGDVALFGGRTTGHEGEVRCAKYPPPLADFLPTITIKAKDFANEITNFNIVQYDLRTEPGISDEHVKNNRDVRKLLVDRGIVPESLPRAEDAKKVERRLKSEQKKLIKQARTLKSPDKETE
jgi:DNA-damage-inducible protein D